MLPKYVPAVASLPGSVCALVRAKLSLPPDRSLLRALQEGGYGAADVVWCLLPAPGPLALDALSALGVRVTVLPPAMPPAVPLPVTRPPAEGDGRRIASVERNPRLPTTPAFARYQEFRPGRTVAECLQRGVTRKDLREAAQNGWVKLEGAL